MNFDNLETREQTSSTRRMYTGIAPIQIIAVNPDTKSLAKILGVDEDKVKTPNYVGEKNTRLDFWYVNHPTFKTELRGKFSIWIDNNTRMSKAGKKQWIDDFTKTAWAENLALLSEAQASLVPERKLDLKSIRESKGGEETIYSLLKAYGNLSPKTKPLVLTSWNSLVKGNGSELTEFFSHFNNANGGIKVLLGIKDGKYQDVFTGIFLNITGKVTDYATKIITGDYGFKSFFNNSYVFNEYNEELAPAMNEVDANAPIMMFSSGNDEVIANPFGESAPSLF
jgi:hypothetical protein